MWGGSLEKRVRVFHPQFDWHESITASILTQDGTSPFQISAWKQKLIWLSVLDHRADDTTTPNSTQGCKSADEDHVVPFTIVQGNSALIDFISNCQGVELQASGPIACTLYYNPCSEKHGSEAFDVVMTVWQSVWAAGVTSTWPDMQEMQDAVVALLSDCDGTSNGKSWGGYRNVEVASGMRMYNVSANQNGLYPNPVGFETFKVTKTSEEQKCDAWSLP